MGSVIYDFLNESFFFDENHVEDNFSRITDDDLRKELSRYRSHIEANYATIYEEATSSGSQLAIVAPDEFFSLAKLAQTALYMDRVVLRDPLLPYTKEPSAVRENLGMFVGFPENWDLDRPRIAGAARFMKSIRLAVAVNYVCFVPDDKDLHPINHFPLYTSSDQFASLVPEQLRDIYRQNVVVRSVDRNDDRARLVDLVPGCSEIAIQFGGNEERQFYSYVYAQAKFTEHDEQTRQVSIVMQRPEGLLDQGEFQAWLTQSINRAASENLNDLACIMHRASTLNSSCMITSPFSQKLLAMDARKPDIASFAGDCFLNLDVQFFRNIVLDDVLRVRQSDGEAFALFRSTLQSKLRELRMERDPERVREKSEEVMHELSETQVAQLSQKISGLKRSAFASGAVAVAALAGSVAAPFSLGACLIAGGIAGANFIQKATEYYNQAKENPSYFLWRVRN